MGKRTVCLVMLSAAFAFPALVGAADTEAVSRPVVPGEKLDSGLGDLSGLKAWRGARPVAVSSVSEKPAMRTDYRVPGEKLDSGLGDLVARASQLRIAPAPERDKGVRP